MPSPPPQLGAGQGPRYALRGECPAEGKRKANLPVEVGPAARGGNQSHGLLDAISRQCGWQSCSRSKCGAIRWVDTGRGPKDLTAMDDTDVVRQASEASPTRYVRRKLPIAMVYDPRDATDARTSGKSPSRSGAAGHSACAIHLPFGASGSLVHGPKSLSIFSGSLF